MHEGETILVIDDNEDLLEAYRLLLEHAGYRVLLAKNGRDGLAMFRGNYEAIDLAIVDWIMPDMKGNELVDDLLAIAPDLKVIFVSAYDLDEATYKWAQSKMIAVVKKPFDPEWLLETVRKALGRNDL